jgi:hypothetical protein
MATPPIFSAGAVLTAAQMNQLGLFKVATGSLSTATSDFVECFTGDYRNYRIVISNVAFSGTGDLYFRMLDGTTPSTTSDYFWAQNGLNILNANFTSNGNGQALAYTGISNNGANNLQIGAVVMDVHGPLLEQRTLITSQAIGVVTDYYQRNGMSVHNRLLAYDGIRFFTNSAVTVTGNVTIYGYRD